MDETEEGINEDDVSFRNLKNILSQPQLMSDIRASATSVSLPIDLSHPELKIKSTGDNRMMPESKVNSLISSIAQSYG